jgi:hypothetical protein
MPKLKPPERTSSEKKIQAKDHSEVHKIGNQYMKISNKLIDRNKSLKVL